MFSLQYLTIALYPRILPTLIPIETSAVDTDLDTFYFDC